MYQVDARRKFLTWGAVCLVALIGGPSLGQDSEETSPANVERAEVTQEQRQQRHQLWTEAQNARLGVTLPAPDIKSAAERAGQLLDLEQKWFGADAQETIQTRELLAACFEDLDQFDAARKQRKEVLRLLEAQKEPTAYKVVDAKLAIESLDTLQQLAPQQRCRLREAYSLRRAVETMVQQGSYGAATAYAEKIKSIRAEILGPDDLATAEASYQLGELLDAMAYFEKSLECYKRALDTWKAKLGEHHPRVASAYEQLVEIMLLYQDYKNAEVFAKRALSIRRSSLELTDPALVRSETQLVHCYLKQRKFKEARILAEGITPVWELGAKTDQSYAAEAMEAWAEVQLVEGIVDMKSRLIALSIYRQSFGEDHPRSIACLFDIARQAWLHRLPIKTVEIAGKAFEDLMSHLHRSAGAQTEQEQFQMMRRNRETFHLWMTVTGAEADAATAQASWQSAVRWKGMITTRLLGMRQRLKNNPRFAELEKLARQRSMLALNPPGLRPRLESLGEGQDSLEQWEAAKDDIETRYVKLERELSLESTEFQRLNARRTITADDVEVALRKSNKPAALVDFYEYWYWGRDGEVSERRLAAFVIRGDHPVQRIELGSTCRIRGQLAVWRESFWDLPALDVAGKELRHRLWEPLTAALDKIDVVLISPDGELGQLPWGALPGTAPNSYLLEERAFAVIPVPQLLAEFMAHDSDNGPRSLLLVGDIDYDASGGEKSPELVNLVAEGDSRRRESENWRFNRLPGTAVELIAIEKEFQSEFAGAEIKSLRAGQATESDFCREASHHQWLHVATHGYFSGRAIPTKEGVAGTSSQPSGVGLQLRVHGQSSIVEWIYAGGAADRDCRLKNGDEVIAIAKGDAEWTNLAGLDQDEVNRLTLGPLGIKVGIRFRAASNPFKVQEITLKTTLFASYTNEMAVHPSLLSGLAFAGVNSPVRDNRDDGILTSMEVSSLDLAHVDGVVLSACESGLGVVSGGEGTLGLQRAFHVAGAKTLVASLWKVSDNATSRLMRGFYTNLWHGELGRLESLRQAQLSLMREGAAYRKELAGRLAHKETSDANPRGLNIQDELPPADGGRLPPYYWAAFVLSGDWR